MKKTRRRYLYGAILVLVVMNGLCIYETLHLRDRLIDAFANQQDAYLRLMEHEMNQAKDPEATIINTFNDIFDTSSRSFGFLVVDEELRFFRDEDGTQASRTSINPSLFIPEQMRNHQLLTLENGIPYLLTYTSFEKGGHQYTFGFLHEETYILDNSSFLSYERHTILFALLCSLALGILILQQYRHIGKQAKEIQEWQIAEKDNRNLIERLLKDLRFAQKHHIEETVFGFLPKEQFVRLLMQMNEHQQSQSHLIRVFVQREDRQIAINLAAILQRMEVLKCVSCEWHPNEFCVLLLHADAIQVENTLRYIITTYRREYHGELHDLRMLTQQVRRDRHAGTTI